MLKQNVLKLEREFLMENNEKPDINLKPSGLEDIDFALFGSS